MACDCLNVLPQVTPWMNKEFLKIIDSAGARAAFVQHFDDLGAVDVIRGPLRGTPDGQRNFRAPSAHIKGKHQPVLVPSCVLQ